jgi:hypothetical protein
MILSVLRWALARFATMIGAATATVTAEPAALSKRLRDIVFFVVATMMTSPRFVSERPASYALRLGTGP